jgi:hypothetical protein
MAHTKTPWKIRRAAGGKKLLCITSAKPLFSSSEIPVRIATMHKLRGFAGDPLANAKLIVAAVNAWHSIDALRARIAELEVRP